MFTQQALEKKERAEKLLAELEEAQIPQQPEIDKEGITEEERYMLRKVGLRMKPFLLLGESFAMHPKPLLHKLVLPQEQLTGHSFNL